MTGGSRSTRKKKNLSQYHFVHHKAQTIFFGARHDSRSCPPLPGIRDHSHSTDHTRYDSSVREIIPSKRPLPNNTQYSQETNIRAPRGILNHNPSKQATADRRLRPRGQRDRSRTDWPGIEPRPPMREPGD